jgi:type VI secretion system protein ImpM
LQSSTARNLCEDLIIETRPLIPLEEEDTPGCYGKIPGTGDFIVRNLPQGFVKQWDRWLQEALQGSRALLGEHWDQTYFTAPIWRFAIAPRVCDDDGWAGVLMPSVDKVGRAFPLTLATSLHSVPQLATAVFYSGHWFAQLEDIALAALAVDSDPGRLEQALNDAPFPEFERGLPAQATAPTAAQWVAQSQDEPFLQLTHPDDFSKVIAVAATETMLSAQGWHAYWWTRGRSEGRPAAVALTGLPDARTFASMLSV